MSNHSSEPHCGCNCCERHLNVREVLPGRTDTERLGWCEAKRLFPYEKMSGWVIDGNPGQFKTPREAIDAAMDQERQR